MHEALECAPGFGGHLFVAFHESFGAAASAMRVKAESTRNFFQPRCAFLDPFAARAVNHAQREIDAP